jgi:hypothetical protein
MLKIEAISGLRSSSEADRRGSRRRGTALDPNTHYVPNEGARHDATANE